MDGDCETTPDIVAAFRAAGSQLSEERIHRKLERWVSEGLLIRKQHHQIGLRGSETRYPVGAGMQAVEIERLLTKTRKFDIVGWEMWRRGYLVGERHWRPRLERAGTRGDRLLSILRLVLRKSERIEHDADPIGRIAEKRAKASVFSKIGRRVGTHNVPRLWHALLPAAAGKFNAHLDDADQKALSEAFDFEQSSDDEAFGRKLKLNDGLFVFLNEISDLAHEVRLRDVLKYTETELDAARNDFACALTLPVDLYEATKWVFGPGAFGLRTAAAIARNMPVDRNPSA